MPDLEPFRELLAIVRVEIAAIDRLIGICPDAGACLILSGRRDRLQRTVDRAEAAIANGGRRDG